MPRPIQFRTECLNPSGPPLQLPDPERRPARAEHAGLRRHLHLRSDRLPLRAHRQPAQLSCSPMSCVGPCEYLGYQVKHVKNITDVGHLRDDTFDEGERPHGARGRGRGQDAGRDRGVLHPAWLEDEAAINILPVDRVSAGPPSTSRRWSPSPSACSTRGLAYDVDGTDLLRRERLPRIRQALRAAARRSSAPVIGSRSRPRQARPRGLRAVEGCGPASAHEVAVTLGRRASRAGTSSARR